METEKTKEMLWYVGSGLLTAGAVALGCMMFMTAFARTVPEFLCDPLFDLGDYPGYYRCFDWVMAADIFISLVLAILMIRATFYYRVREQYVEPFLRWFFQWLTRGKGEAP